MAKHVTFAGAAALAFSAILLAGQAQPAHALTMQECSVKYKAAQSAGSLAGMKWNDFRAKECGSDAAAGAAAAPAAAAKPAAAAVKETVKEPAAPTMAAPAGMTFPRAVSSKYATETAGKARMHTCLDAYNEAKAKNALNGLKWIQKGGGYYSLCNSSLKAGG